MVRIYYNCIQGRGVCYLFTILVQNVPVKIKTRLSRLTRLNEINEITCLQNANLASGPRARAASVPGEKKGEAGMPMTP